MGNTNNTNPPMSKDLSDFKELQEREHYIQAEDTNERVQRTVTLKQFVFGLLLMWAVCTFIGKFSSGRYWFEASNEEWLWSSHNMFVAIVEDDPKFLTKEDSWAWKRFQEMASTARLKGFVRVVHDGEHPNLQKWYLQDQLRQLEPNSEDGMARKSLKG